MAKHPNRLFVLDGFGHTPEKHAELAPKAADASVRNARRAMVAATKRQCATSLEALGNAHLYLGKAEAHRDAAKSTIKAAPAASVADARIAAERATDVVSKRCLILKRGKRRVHITKH